MARPSILNKQLITDFCLNLRMTGSIEAVIARTGIGRETYYRWARLVREGCGTGLEKRFMKAVDQSEGEVKMRLELQLEPHFVKHWRALAWWLERKYAGEYGRKRPMAALVDPIEEPLYDGIKLIKKGETKTPGAITAKTTEAAAAGHFEAFERVSGAWVSGDHYEKLGLKPLAGRLLTPDDDCLDAPLVGMITDAYWSRRFGRDPRIVGRIMRIEGVPVTIVGVVPPDGTSISGGQVADVMMTTGVMPRVPSGSGARRIGWDEQECGEPPSFGEFG